MSATDRPFQVRAAAATTLNAPAFDIAADADELSMDELEAAYLAAVEAADAVMTLPGETLPELAESEPRLHIATSAVSDHVTAAAPAAQRTAEPTLQTQHVLEAFLFVGQEALTAERLQELLGGRTTIEAVERDLEQLNATYRQQGRPYEIVLGDAGYALKLTAEFEPVRQRVHGQGPKEVKLTQDALEVLALIAYKQPVTREALGETGKANVGDMLRQLLRRQLIELRRNDDHVEEFRTTQRFLELFALRSLHDLPRAVDFQFK